VVEEKTALPAGLIWRDDGVYLEGTASSVSLLGAVDAVFTSHFYFTGLDYSVLIDTLFPLRPRATDGLRPPQRLAAGVERFDPQREALYKKPKMGRGYAEYYFEQLWLEEMELPDGTIIPERQTHMDIDEFIAAMWVKGIRFGLDVKSIKTAIHASKPERITVAEDLEPAPGIDATVVEVAHELHRSDAPRERGDGTVDLLSFQNRFPQIQENMRLLKKQPPQPGLPGYDMAGRITPPSPPKDLVLANWGGDGTRVENHPDGEFLISVRVGFLNVDSKSNRISITDKIISKEGVGRTTGNLELAGAFEEFGDVQEMRELTGSDITVHGNVYGDVTSRGGRVVLGKNLVGGNVLNADGDIEIKGVASGAVIHSRTGRINIGRAENCVISAPKVKVDEASNCEIVADEVFISMAEGCAIVGRNVEIESAGPGRRTEMLIYVLLRDVTRFDAEIEDLTARVADLARAIGESQGEIDRVSALPDVRRYLALAVKLRNQELTLTAEQGQVLRKIAGAVANELQEIARHTQDLQASQTQYKLLSDRLERVIEQKIEAAGHARCGLHMMSGETNVRSMVVQGEGEGMYLLPAKEIKQRLRGTPSGELLHSASAGSLDWHLDVRPKLH
jgi:hypothetical protein